MRFHGRIGYVDTVETKPGLWEKQLVFRTYYGDVIRNTKRDSLGSKVNADIQVTNQIRIPMLEIISSNSDVLNGKGLYGLRLMLMHHNHLD